VREPEEGIIISYTRPETDRQTDTHNTQRSIIIRRAIRVDGK
jgi:hypothetical protein